jgi:hypothetical protein
MWPNKRFTPKFAQRCSESLFSDGGQRACWFAGQRAQRYAEYRPVGHLAEMPAVFTYSMINQFWAQVTSLIVLGSMLTSNLLRRPTPVPLFGASSSRRSPAPEKIRFQNRLLKLETPRR